MTDPTLETLLRIEQRLEQILERLDRPRVPGPLLLKPRQAAELISVPPKRIAGLVANGTLRCVPVGSRYLIPFSELERLARLPPVHFRGPGRKPTKHRGEDVAAAIRALKF